MTWSALLLAVVGCAHPVAPPPQPALPTATRVAGMSVVTRPLPTPGRVRLSLWIDAGSRDVQPPQTALVAAWQAAQRTGLQTHARVLPDSTELSLDCATTELARCLEGLGRALSQRSADAVQLQQSRRRLSAGRRHALDADPGRDADRLALQALYGEAAWGFFPLGPAQRDVELQADGVGAFFAAHYGPERALLVAAGDVREASLSDGVRRHLTQAPAAGQARAARAGPGKVDGGVLTRPANATFLSMAVLAPDLDQAWGAAEAVRRELRALGPEQEVLHGHTFPIRGGALTLLRLGRPADGRRVLLATAAVEHYRQEHSGSRRPPVADGSLPALIRSTAMQWLAAQAQGQQPLPLTAAGVGAELQAGRGRGPRRRKGRPKRGPLLADRLREAHAQALAAARLEPEGVLEQERASLLLDNGARIEGRHQPGPAAAMVVRFQGGAAADSPELHGRAALSAIALAHGCDHMGEGGLNERLQALQARLDPFVTGGDWGLAMRFDPQQWQPALELLLRCALQLEPSAGEVVSARVRLGQRLEQQPANAAELAAAGRLIAADAPGWVAPLGDPIRVGTLGLTALHKGLKAARTGRRLTVAFSGPLDPQTVSRAVARRLALLPEGQPWAMRSPAGPPGPQAGAHGHGTVPEPVTVAWRCASRGAVGAAVLSRHVARALTGRPGLELQWRRWGEAPWGSWIALGLSVQPGAMGELAQELERAVARPTPLQARRSLDQAVAADRRLRADDQGRPLWRAMQLARGESALGPTLPDPASERRVLEDLRRSTPTWRRASTP